MSKDAPEQTISVTASDPTRKDDGKADGAKEPAKKAGLKDEEEISEEDAALKAELELYVERLKEPDTSLHRPALEGLRTAIRTSTSSMTSVPKPLKLLRPHFDTLQSIYDSWPASADKGLFADILSVLAMTYADTGKRLTLEYRLKGGSEEDPGEWGNEYVRHLAAEIGQENEARETTAAASDSGDTTSVDRTDLIALALRLVPFFLKHNGEADAVDLLSELEQIAAIVPHVDDDTYQRVCLYMVSCVPFLLHPDDRLFLKTARDVYKKANRLPEALVLSLRLNDMVLIKEDFDEAKNDVMRAQLAHILARQQVPFISEPPSSEPDDPSHAPLYTEDEAVLNILRNTDLSEHFKQFGTELKAVEPKSLDDIYKTYLESGSHAPTVDSARLNLAGLFVNGFVNAGFGNDPLIAQAEDGKSWVYKTKDNGKFSATASLGLSYLFNPDEGLGSTDKYTYSNDVHVKAGAILATAISNAGVKQEGDTVAALFREYFDEDDAPTQASFESRIAAVMGLGIAYAGAHHEDSKLLLLPLVENSSTKMELAALAAMSLALIYPGSCNGEITAAILGAFIEREETDLKDKWARYMGLALALLYIGRPDSVDAVLETLRAVEAPIGVQSEILVEMCAYAGTGSVLKIQSMLHHCTDHLNKEEEEEEKKEGEGEGEKKEGSAAAAAVAAEGAGAAGAGAPASAEGADTNGTTEGEGEKKDEEKEKKDETYQALAVLGIAVIAMGEEVGADMSLRQFSHLMHYGEPVIRRAVPLALGLLSASHPNLAIIDTLSKYSHDNDTEVALNAIFAMGLIGAGTNNARLAQLLRALSTYYGGDKAHPDCSFMVRIAQGLVHMGKGLLGVSPFHTDRSLLSPTALAGLLATIVSFTDFSSFVGDKAHYLLYYLVPAIYPRFLITLNEDLEKIAVDVRVGQAVDVVGQAGRPRTIAGFQTHSTPVRLATSERAELATDEYLPYSKVLEGVVILGKNPGYEKEDVRMTDGTGKNKD